MVFFWIISHRFPVSPFLFEFALYHIISIYLMGFFDRKRLIYSQERLQAGIPMFFDE